MKPQTAPRLEVEGARVYVLGNTFPIKDKLKRAGCHFDGARRAWWIGAAKKDAVEALVSGYTPPSQDEVQEQRLQRDRDNILGRAEYKGRSYYLVGEGTNDRGPWVRLMFTDGSKTFFASSIPYSEGPVDGKARVTKMYQSPKSLDDLRAYAQRMKREQATGECECWCHRSAQCDCDSGFCHFHHDGCESCGCEG